MSCFVQRACIARQHSFGAFRHMAGRRPRGGNLGSKSHFGIGHFKTWVVMARWTRLDELIPNLTAPHLAFYFRLSR